MARSRIIWAKLRIRWGPRSSGFADEISSDRDRGCAADGRRDRDFDLAAGEHAGKEAGSGAGGRQSDYRDAQDCEFSAAVWDFVDSGGSGADIFYLSAAFGEKVNFVFFLPTCMARTFAVWR